jgi:hypothetical protein
MPAKSLPLTLKYSGFFNKSVVLDKRSYNMELAKNGIKNIAIN